MVFSSSVFLFLFLPFTLTVNYLLRPKFRNGFLLIMSLIFFAWSQPQYLWLILLNVLINYLGALLISKQPTHSKAWLVITVVLNLFMLGYFKYFNFIVANIEALTRLELNLTAVILPVGISFFTFQALSYTIDVYRKRVPVQKNYFSLLLYVSLFPQLIAGPIVRYADIDQEISDRTVTMDDFYDGIKRFCYGLGKKTIIANTLAVAVDAVWNNGISEATSLILWVTSAAYCMQLYFDFSGYSDMAIGLGRMFGFHFLENFNLPFISKSITEVWRRWHISLSSWFRDYVYIPLGGNRRHVYRNLFIVFFLTGVWHGAEWTFIIWGVYQGVFVIAERLIRSHLPKKREEASLFKNFWKHIYALVVFDIGFVFFRAPDLAGAIEYLKGMLGIGLSGSPDFSLFWYYDRFTILVLVLAMVLSSGIQFKIADWFKSKSEKGYVWAADFGCLAILFVCFLLVAAGSYNPFIYFQF